MAMLANFKSSIMSKEVKLVKVARPLKEKDENLVITNKKTTQKSSSHDVLKKSIDVLQG